jgi:hypothetical protein
MVQQPVEVKSTMCVHQNNQSCDCASRCGCMNVLSIEDEIKLLEAGRQRMQVQLGMTERKIEGLKKKI